MITGTAGTGNLSPVNMLFTGLPETDFADFMAESDRFYDRHPDIEKAIRGDLELHGKKKKRDRLRDQRWERFHNVQPLQQMEPDWKEIRLEEIELQQGRPRIMDPYATFMFMMARGYQGGESSRDFQDLIQESRTIYVLLQNRDISMPAPSTINENLNAVRNGTRDMIHRRHLEDVRAEGLDDFTEMTIDSTGMEANSAWPTDSMIITGLIDRIWRTGNKLEQFGTDNFQRGWTECRLDKLRELNFRITNADTTRERRKWYRRVYDFAEKALDHLRSETNAFEERVEPGSLKPSLRSRLKDVQACLGHDLANARKVISYSKKRVLEGQQTSSEEKVLSLADGDLAFIEKGDREPIIGYRLQLGRSGNGFIGYLEVPEGNQNDSIKIVPAVEGWKLNTSVLPSIVSGDDGYASEKAIEKLKKLGVGKVSISGSKGKRLLSREEWNDPRISQARRERSKVESTIYTMKYGFDLDRASRTGVDAVRAECLEKAIAYNLHRAVKVRRRQRSESLSRAA